MSSTSSLSFNKNATQSVSFCRKDDDSLIVKIQEFPMIEEFERPLIWWSRADFARFRMVCNKTFQTLQTGDDQEQSPSNTNDDYQHQDTIGTEKKRCDQEDSFFCFRGLETWRGKPCRERRERIKKAIQLVLESQEHSDPFACANAYHEHTSNQRIQAQVRGAQDEDAVHWECIQDEVLLVPVVQQLAMEQQVNNDIIEEIAFSSSKLYRVKRRRSSGVLKKGGRSPAFFGMSLKIFARRISLPSAA